MKNYLNFLINREVQFEKYFVSAKTLKRKSYGGKYELEVVVITLDGVIKKDKYKLSDIDSGKDDFNWGGALRDMLLMSKDALEDFESYRWAEIKKPVVDYWIRKQQVEIEEQKKRNAKTIWTPAGDYTLSIVAEFMSRALLAKYITLRDRSILDVLKKENIGFERDFDKSTLNPLKAYMDIEDIVDSKQNESDTSVKIVEYLASSNLSNFGERILDPDYDDDTPMLTHEEEIELGALWKIYSEEEKIIKENARLSEIEKRIQMQEFYRSPQGKRLNDLNAGRVRGGKLSFEEKEEKKRIKKERIVEALEDLLTSWGIDYQNTKKGIEHYEYLYQKELAKRWEQEKHFNLVLSKSKREIEAISEALEGSWNSNNLTLFGVILSIGLSVSFGLSSLVTSYKVIVGLLGGIISIGICILIIKNKFIRKKILLLMNSILK